MKATHRSGDYLQLARLVFKLSRQLTRTFDDVLQPSHGLATKDLIVLRQLREGSVYPGEISARLGMPPASVSRALERLESKGYIVRSVDAADRRRFRLATTPRGEAAVRDIRKLLTDTLRGAYDHVPVPAIDGTVAALATLSEEMERTGA